MSQNQRPYVTSSLALSFMSAFGLVSFLMFGGAMYTGHNLAYPDYPTLFYSLFYIVSLAAFTLFWHLLFRNRYRYCEDRQH